MRVDSFLSSLTENGISFFTGVPDSQLKALCDYLNSEKPESNITAANEGNAAAIAAGYYMATKNVPCVYLQNSGLGNIIAVNLSHFLHALKSINLICKFSKIFICSTFIMLNNRKKSVSSCEKSFEYS